MARKQALYRLPVYYDVAMRHDVGREVDFVQALFRRTRGRELRSVLDLACGPGTYARMLAARGVKVAALDGNPDMVEYARQRAAAEGLEVTWLVSDLRQFQLEEPVDMAICMFDGIAELLADEDIVQHLRSVEANLVPGGLYLIECTHPRDSFLQDYGHFHYAGTQDGVSAELLWAVNNPSYDVVTGVAQVEVEMRIVDRGETRVVRDTILERAYSAQELRLAAELSAGLRVVDWFGDFDLDQPLDNSPASRRLLAVVQRVALLDEDRERPTCYLSPKLEGRLNAEGGRGVFCREPVEAGERLAVFGGEVMGPEELEAVPEILHHVSIQVEEDLYLVPAREGPGDWFNHSCDPNAGLVGQIALVALRDILPGEEVCFDYATSDGSPYDEFECYCGAPACRRQVTGEDWRRPELWERYAGHFSPYLQRRLDALRAAGQA